VHRDEETGETIVGGLSQMHVETVLERMHRAVGVEVELKAAPVPYRETIRSRRGLTAATRSRPAAAGSSATARSRSSR